MNPLSAKEEGTMDKLARFSLRKTAFRAAKRTIAIAATALALAMPSATFADPVLQESLFNLNATTYHNTFAVPGLNTAGFDSTTGLGVLTLTFSPGVGGSYFFDVFFDHELHTPFNNEYGSVNGAPGAGVSWQIDVPGSGDGNRIGTIFANAQANSLDNTNHVPGTVSNFLNNCGANTLGEPPNPACNNDVSMAFGFNFILAADEVAIITVIASETAPASGFSLRQIDPDTPSNLYLSGSIAIGQVTSVPEPGALLLLAAAAFAGLTAGSLRRRLRV
jgi:hypothetical protein